MRILSIIAVVLLATTPAFAAVNLLTNGDFETGPFVTANTITGWTCWTQSTSSASNYNKNATDNGAPVYAGASAYLASAKTGVAPGIVFVNHGCYQEVSVTPGQTYEVDGWINGFGDTSGITQYLFEVGVIDGGWNEAYVDGANNVLPVGAYAVTSLAALTTPTPTTYVQVSANVLPSKSNVITASGSTLTVYLRAGGIMSDTGKKIRFRADNMSLELVPEPGALIALVTGLVGLGGILRRRR